jgi:glycolate oxidase FAD binding subunit
VTSSAALLDGLSVLREEFPSSVDELAEAVKRAAASKEPMSATGGGTKLHIGNPLRSAPVVIHTDALSGVLEYEPDNLTVSALAGTRLGELQKVLRARRQFLPLDPPAAEAATLGGLLACNTSGPLRFRYGTIKDILLGIRILHADGTRTKAGGKLVKNVTGYDMCRLYAGSLGTLGIFTELTFKVSPLPETGATLLASYRDLDSLLQARQNCLTAGLLPDAVEGWNSSAFAPLGTAAPPAPWLLMVRFGDVRPAVEWQRSRLREIVARTGGRTLEWLENEASERFWQSASSLRETIEGTETAVIKCSALHRSTSEAALRMARIADRLGARLSVYCHAGACVLYGRFVWNEARPQPLELRRELEDLRKYCVSAGGHAVIERASRAVKEGIDVWGYEAPALEIMRRIKREFDPNGLLNPGRFVGGI